MKKSVVTLRRGDYRLRDVRGDGGVPGVRSGYASVQGAGCLCILSRSVAAEDVRRRMSGLRAAGVFGKNGLFVERDAKVMMSLYISKSDLTLPKPSGLCTLTVCVIIWGARGHLELRTGHVQQRQVVFRWYGVYDVQSVVYVVHRFHWVDAVRFLGVNAGRRRVGDGKETESRKAAGTRRLRRGPRA